MRAKRTKKPTRWPIVVTLRIGESDREWLQLQAEAKGFSVSDVVRNLIAKASGRCK